MRLFALAAWLVPLLAHPAPAFLLPIDCQIGKSCVVQNYVDVDAGPAARDFRLAAGGMSSLQGLSEGFNRL